MMTTETNFQSMIVKSKLSVSPRRARVLSWKIAAWMPYFKRQIPKSGLTAGGIHDIITDYNNKIPNTLTTTNGKEFASWFHYVGAWLDVTVGYGCDDAVAGEERRYQMWYREDFDDWVPTGLYYDKNRKVYKMDHWWVRVSDGN